MTNATENEVRPCRDIFVFGSNLAGRHGAGAAKFAKENFGAEYGVGSGFTGDSYAIPTKNGSNGANLRDPRQTLSLDLIKQYVDQFKITARRNSHLRFIVTRIGCGRAGYTDSQIAPLFKGCPPNCVMPVEWIEYLREEENAGKE